jgi:hypothetical protein
VDGEREARTGLLRWGGGLRSRLPPTSRVPGAWASASIIRQGGDTSDQLG